MISGGVRKVSWLVLCPQEEDWISVFNSPEVQAEDLDRTPGIVWQKRVCLPLETDRRLLRVESRPVARERRDPMSYLEGTRTNAKVRTLRSEFRVDARGQLVRVSRDPSPRK